MNNPSDVSGDRLEALPVLRTVFAAWSAFFVCFIIPLELLFRIDAFINYLPPVHILLNALLVLLFYVALSCGIALFSLLICAGLQPFITGRASRARLVLTANIAVILTGFIYKLLNTSVVWSKAVTKWEFDAGKFSTPLVLISLVAAVAAVLAKPQWVVNILAVARRAFRPIIVILVGALLIIAIPIITTLTGQIIGQNEKRNSAPGPMAGNRPNVILITMDALSANDMSLYGYHLPTTPNLEAFSRQSFIFDHAYANSNFTTPGVASILTGKYPVTSKVYSYFNFLTPAIRRENLAHELHRAGYETVALFANAAGHPNHNGSYLDFDHAPLIDCLHRLDSLSIVTSSLLALERFGFHPYPWFGERLAAVLPQIEGILLRLFPGERAERDQVYARRPDITLQIARGYLHHSSAPLFIWIHLLAPHAPYLPTPLYKYRFLPERIFTTAASQRAYSNSHFAPKQQPLIDKLRLRYDEQIASTDAALGLFLVDLAKEGYQDNSIIIITADHGELFEKGYHEHGGAGCMFLYQPLIHIPLMVHLPGQTTTRRISANAEQVDLAPTILDLLHLSSPGWMEGESLRPAILGKNPGDKPKFAMNLELCSTRKPIVDGSVAVLQGSDKYIYYVRSRKAELFDLVTDPGEDRNLVATSPEKAKAMHRQAVRRLGLD